MKLVDQTNHPIIIESKAIRIVSLVPSQTELLHYFGLETETVGITKFCIHPNNWYNSKIRVGGTKSVDIKQVEMLKPDLILANKEENSKADIERLRLLYPVYTSDIVSVKDVFQMITDVGKLTGRQAAAKTINTALTEDFRQLPAFSGTVLYLIWRNPYMAAGTHTFINTMLSLIGFDNAHSGNLRYDELSLTEIKALNPDYIFLSSEPYPFKKQHIAELKEVVASKIILVDGEMFSWYGSRLAHFRNYIQNNLIPQLRNSIRQ